MCLYLFIALSLSNSLNPETTEVYVYSILQVYDMAYNCFRQNTSQGVHQR